MSQAICSGFEKSELNHELVNAIRETNNEPAKINTWDLSERVGYKSNSFTQFRWLVWRSFLSSSRNPLETKIMAIQTIFIALMFGLIYLQLALDQKNLQNINSVLFLCITNSSFSNLFGVINTFPAEIPIFLREHQNRMYRVFNYYFAKTIVEVRLFLKFDLTYFNLKKKSFVSQLPKYIIFPIIFVSIVYWMAGLNSDIERFLICVGTIILVANCAVSFGSFLSCACPSVSAALAISGPILVPLMIFSGFFLNNATVPGIFF
jgi:hypothetical protein